MSFLTVAFMRVFKGNGGDNEKVNVGNDEPLMKSLLL